MRVKARPRTPKLPRAQSPKELKLRRSDKEATEAIDKKWVESVEKKELTMKFMKEADKETGRLLKESPLFSDGTYLYVVSQRKHIKTEDVDEDAPAVPTALVVEQYCPKTWRHLKSTTLFKHVANEIFTDKKQTDVDEYLKTTTFHTNGRYLMLCFQNKRHLFDLETGIRVDKQKAEDDFCSFVFHDHRNNIFYTVNLKDTTYFLSDFTVEVLKILKVSTTQSSFATPIENIRD